MTDAKVLALVATQENDNGSTKVVFKAVPNALALGFLAVHQIPDELGESTKGQYRITHLPTGYAVGRYEQEDVALLVRDALVGSKIAWDFTNPKQITREIVDQVKEISSTVLDAYDPAVIEAETTDEEVNEAIDQEHERVMAEMDDDEDEDFDFLDEEPNDDILAQQEMEDFAQDGDFENMPPGGYEDEDDLSGILDGLDDLDV